MLRKAGKKDELPEPQVEFTCSREYWSGWILAYYQWYSEKKFKEIEAGLPVREVVEMYPALHEAPEDKFVEAADRIIRRKEQGKNALRSIFSKSHASNSISSMASNLGFNSTSCPLRARS